jgi:hypothetical protein
MFRTTLRDVQLWIPLGVLAAWNPAFIFIH